MKRELGDKEQELNNAMEEIKRLREQVNVDDIPKAVIVDDKIGLIKKRIPCLR